MKKNTRNLLTLGMLSVLVVSLAFLLSGCGLVTEEPTAKINKSVGSGGQEYTFDGSNSEPSDDITEYEWTFGDGSNTVTGESVDHTYDSVGSFTVTLTVTTDAGKTDSTSITVSPGVSASFDIETVADVQTGAAQVEFDSSGSTSAAGDIVQYDWSFDYPDVQSSEVDPPADSYSEGTTTTDPVTYLSTGEYDVVLQVKDENDNYDSVGKVLNVQTGSATLE